MHVLATVHRIRTSFHHGLPLATLIIGTCATLAWNLFLVYVVATLVRRFI
jgi:hypothetical protein